MDTTTTQDYRFMHYALKEAEKALRVKELPIGAVVVSCDGVIIGRGYNKTESSFCQSNHAEVRAIAQAGKKIRSWRLEQCTIYITLEPCIMCMGLIALSRIERVVYGAQSPLFGYTLDKEMLPTLYKKHIKGVTSGVLAHEAEQVLKKFFKDKRKKGE